MVCVGHKCTGTPCQTGDDCPLGKLCLAKHCQAVPTPAEEVGDLRRRKREVSPGLTKSKSEGKVMPSEISVHFFNLRYYVVNNI